MLPKRTTQLLFELLLSFASCPPHSLCFLQPSLLPSGGTPLRVSSVANTRAAPHRRRSRSCAHPCGLRPAVPPYTAASQLRISPGKDAALSAYLLTVPPIRIIPRVSDTNASQVGHTRAFIHAPSLLFTPSGAYPCCCQCGSFFVGLFNETAGFRFSNSTVRSTHDIKIGRLFDRLCFVQLGMLIRLFKLTFHATKY